MHQHQKGRPQSKDAFPPILCDQTLQNRARTGKTQIDQIIVKSHQTAVNLSEIAPPADKGAKMISFDLFNRTVSIHSVPVNKRTEHIFHFTGCIEKKSLLIALIDQFVTY